MQPLGTGIITSQRIAVHTLLAILLAGVASSETLPLSHSCSPNVKQQAPTDQGVQIYFGCGCFWHMQHEFAMFEKSEKSGLARQDSELTARAAYAGGKKCGPDGLLCYHNLKNYQEADYGLLGHAEAVELDVPLDSFDGFAQKFWEVCPLGQRQDPQDVGGEYRSVVGLPGGINSELARRLQQATGPGVTLVAGAGGEPDTLNSGKVFVYDTKDFPARTAEKHHQFHNDMRATYGDDYNNLRKTLAKDTSCPGD